MKKITLHSELIYILATLILSFSSAMQTAANLGISMIIAPAYIVSQKLTFLTFGQSEYLVQGLVFIAFCVLMKGFKPVYLASFGTALFYGAALDMWRTVIPAFNQSVTVPGSMPMPARIAMLGSGMIITASTRRCTTFSCAKCRSATKKTARSLKSRSTQAALWWRWRFRCCFSESLWASASELS